MISGMCWDVLGSDMSQYVTHQYMLIHDSYYFIFMKSKEETVSLSEDMGYTTGRDVATPLENDTMNRWMSESESPSSN